MTTNDWMHRQAKEWMLDVGGVIRRTGGLKSTHMFDLESEAERARAELVEARAIWREVERSSRGRIAQMLDDYERQVGRGDTASAESDRRTIEDMCAHWRDGRYVGLREIRGARAICREYADVGSIEVQS